MGIEYAITDEYELYGWTQSGQIDGTKYAVWTRVINGHRCSIAIGKETKKILRSNRWRLVWTLAVARVSS